MHPWYLFNLGKCNSFLTFHLFKNSYHSLSIYILIHHTCASLAYFYIIHSYLFGLNINLHTRQPYNAFNPCTQAYTKIDKYPICKFTSCTFFHVIHSHGHFKLPNPSSQRSYIHSCDSLIGVLDTMFTSPMIDYNHSHGKSHIHIHHYVVLYT
jgi:hypothetical protein